MRVLGGSAAMKKVIIGFFLIVLLGICTSIISLIRTERASAQLFNPIVLCVTPTLQDVFNVTGGDGSATGSLFVANVFASQTLWATGGIQTAGNATAAFFYGDGSHLTGLPTFATPTLDEVLSTGNTTSYPIYTSDEIYASSAEISGPINSSSTIYASGTIHSDGDITASGTFYGDGSGLTGISTTTSTFDMTMSTCCYCYGGTCTPVGVVCGGSFCACELTYTNGIVTSSKISGTATDCPCDVYSTHAYACGVFP
jgi:hypothetical protein